jgi:hypothetical protein
MQHTPFGLSSDLAQAPDDGLPTSFDESDAWDPILLQPAATARGAYPGVRAVERAAKPGRRRRRPPFLMTDSSILAPIPELPTSGRDEAEELSPEEALALMGLPASTPAPARQSAEEALSPEEAVALLGETPPPARPKASEPEALSPGDAVALLDALTPSEGALEPVKASRKTSSRRVARRRRPEPSELGPGEALDLLQRELSDSDRAQSPQPVGTKRAPKPARKRPAGTARRAPTRRRRRRWS